MVTTRFRSLAVALLVFASGCATAPQFGARERNTLWAVHSGEHTLYLMGSVHVLPRTAYPLSRVMQQAFESSGKIVFEIDLSKYSDAEILRAIEKDATYPKHDSLENHLSPAALELLQQVLPEFGISFEAATRYRAGFLADAIMAQFLDDAGIRSEYGVDNYYFEKAKRAGKKVAGLEGLRDQTTIYKDISDAEAEKYLVGTLLSLPAIEKFIREVAKAWKSGRTAKLDKLLNTQAEKDPKLNRALFVTRNRAWLPQIEAMIGGPRNTLVIVGTGHLVGRHGIISELRRIGYTVEQL